MEPLVTIADLQEYLQDDDMDTAQAQQAIELASGAVRTYTGQTISADTTTSKTFRPKGKLLILDEVPVDAESVQITIDGELFTGDIDVDGETGVVRRDDGRSWPAKVTVTFDHGYDEIPDAVRFVTLSLATRQVDNPEGVSTKQTPDIGSITYAEGQGQPGMRTWEMAQLSRFKGSL